MKNYFLVGALLFVVAMESRVLAGDDDELEFLENLTSLLSAEASLEKYVVNVSCVAEVHSQDELLKKELVTKEVWIAFDRKSRYLRMDVDGDSVFENGDTRRFFFRFLRLDKMQYVGNLERDDYRIGKIEGDFTGKLFEKITSPFSLWLNGTAIQIPSHDFEQDFFDFASYFPPDHIEYAVKEKDRLKGVMRSPAGQFFVEFVFEKGAKVPSRCLQYVRFADMNSEIGRELAKKQRVENLAGTREAMVAAKIDWTVHAGVQVPKEVTIIRRIEREKDQFTYKLQWLSTEPTDAVFDPKEVNNPPGRDTALQRLFEKRASTK